MYQVLFAALRALSHNDAEKAHRFAVRALYALEKHEWTTRLLRRMAGDSPQQPIKLLGITFPNRVGLAAGFDKNAECLVALQALGFGFIEVGTVLPRAQIGNPRPRIFRLPEMRSIINRMGFNSDGVNMVVGHLNLYKQSGRLTIPLGISLGKMKTTPNEWAIEDYLAVLEDSCKFGDYLVANVSSPNTPGLRELQEKTQLEALLSSLVKRERERRQRWELSPRPLLVKIAPDNMENAVLADIVEVVVQSGASGIVIGNTTMTRPSIAQLVRLSSEVGGLSGPSLFAKTLELVGKVRAMAPNLPIIAVGGIDSGSRARKAIDAGADLVQIYTGFIYRGPHLVHELRKELAAV